MSCIFSTSCVVPGDQGSEALLNVSEYHKVFTVKSCEHLAQLPSWRTTPRLLSAAISIFEVVPIRNLRTPHAVVTETHLSRSVFPYTLKTNMNLEEPSLVAYDAVSIGN